MEKKIHVETVGYYHQKADLTASVDFPPKEINRNKKYFEDPHLKFPILNLNIKVPSDGCGGSKLESLMDYTRLKGWPNGAKPDFVTNKQILSAVASHHDRIDIQAIRFQGVTFLLRPENRSNQFEMFKANGNFGLLFRHFFTKETDNEGLGEDKTERYGVFKATISCDDRSWNVVYSGQVSGINSDGEHYDFQVARGGEENPYYWMNKSCRVYWKLFFGNVKYTILGSRTHRYPHDPKTRGPLFIPEHSVYKVAKLEPHELPQEMMKFSKDPKRPFKAWTVSDGEANVQKFFKLVNETVTADGEAFMFSRSVDSPEWRFSKNGGEEVEEFIEKNLQKIPSE